MRSIIIAALLLLSSCATTENNHTNQVVRHDVCKLSDEHVALVVDHFAQSGIDITMRIDFCGQLSEPHSDLGFAIFETTGVTKSGQHKHLVTVLRFGKIHDNWVVLGEPQLLSDLVQEGLN